MSGVGEMERCLEEKAGLLKGLLAETKRIGLMLDSRDTDGLSASVGERQACIVKIDELDKRIKNCGSTTKAGSVAEGKFKKEIQALLGEILEIDAANMNVAGEITATLMSGIREANAGKNMLKYYPSMQPESRFVDREG